MLCTVSNLPIKVRNQPQRNQIFAKHQSKLENRVIFHQRATRFIINPAKCLYFAWLRRTFCSGFSAVDFLQSVDLYCARFSFFHHVLVAAAVSIPRDPKTPLEAIIAAIFIIHRHLYNLTPIDNSKLWTKHNLLQSGTSRYSPQNALLWLTWYVDSDLLSRQIVHNHRVKTLTNFIIFYEVLKSVLTVVVKFDIQFK